MRQNAKAQGLYRKKELGKLIWHQSITNMFRYNIYRIQRNLTKLHPFERPTSSQG